MMIAVRATLVDPATVGHNGIELPMVIGRAARTAFGSLPTSRCSSLWHGQRLAIFRRDGAFRAWASHRNNGLAVVESRDHALIVGVRNLAMREFVALPRAGLRLPVQN